MKVASTIEGEGKLLPARKLLKLRFQFTKRKETGALLETNVSTGRITKGKRENLRLRSQNSERPKSEVERTVSSARERERERERERIRKRNNTSCLAPCGL